MGGGIGSGVGVWQPAAGSVASGGVGKGGGVGGRKGKGVRGADSHRRWEGGGEVESGGGGGVKFSLPAFN